jgi:hypothetical protein
MAEMSEEMKNANRGAISARNFEVEARRIAKLMKERFNIGFVDIGGWDTHVGQGAATGYLANRLEQLGRGLVAYSEEMGPRWQETVVVVVSEFGRTFRENGNRGTDHGHGTVYWVLGGGIRGGRVAGEQVRVEQATLFQNRDYPVLNEYRAVLGGLFTRMYGLDKTKLASVFPDAEAKDIGLVDISGSTTLFSARSLEVVDLAGCGVLAQGEFPILHPSARPLTFSVPASPELRTASRLPRSRFDWLEQRVRNFDRGLHRPLLPYLRLDDT